MQVSKKLCLCVLLTLAMPFSLTGCGKKKPADDAAAAATSAEGGQATAPTGDTPGTDESLTSAGSGLTGAGSAAEGRTSGPMLPVFFNYDSSKIEGDQVSRIEHNGDFLKENKDKKIRVEGNCDERGTREYNLALGERRANAAKKYLIHLGVEANRLSTVSWGEEKPLVFGQDEQSWTQNRRADFVFAE